MKNGKLEMNKLNRVSLAAALMGAALSISGCGQVAYHDGVAANSASSQTGSTSSAPSAPSTGSQSTPNPSQTSTPVADASANYNYDFVLQGYGLPTSTYESPPIYTDTILKVTVNAGQPMNTYINGKASNFTANYSCQQITVTVLGVSKKALVTNDPENQQWWMPCYGAKRSVTLDFSNILGAGHDEITVKLTNPLYDNCRQYDGVAYAGCQLNTLYTGFSDHSDFYQMNGSLDIAVNSVDEG